MPDVLFGGLDRESAARFEEHIASCESCRTGLEDMRQVWSALERIPQEDPGPEVSARFYTMLAAYREGLNGASAKVSWFERANGWLSTWWPRRPVMQLGTAVAFLIIGVMAGQMATIRVGTKSEIAGMRKEMQDMRELVTLALLEQPSAVDRLRGVSMSRQLSGADNQVVSTLLKTLNTDPNVNVRIAATDAIRNYCDRDWVRIELIRSLGSQTSPLVQVSLIDVLTSIRETRASDAFKSLIDDERSIEPVKKRAQLALDRII
jgi:hypothetical protein